MSDILEGFVQKKEFLVCIDSDGCAIDSMESKHKTCFGPCLVRQWKLEPWEDQILNRWNEINLYTQTRGINRYKGLALILREVDQKYKRVDGLEALEGWVQSATELSDAGIEERWKECGALILKQALEWSRQVNSRINVMPPEEKCAFEGVRQALHKAHEMADLVIVSSANRQAVLEEWKRQGLLEYADLVLSQDAGTKADCIRSLLTAGYDHGRVLMVGDAPGDCLAAEENAVLFYPIMVNRETESWKRFMIEALDKLKQGTYAGAYEQQLIEAFRDNLRDRQ